MYVDYRNAINNKNLEIIIDQQGPLNMVSILPKKYKEISHL